MSFSLVIGFGAALGLGWVALRAGERARLGRASRKAPPAVRLLDAGLWVLLGGLVGGRAGHVAVAWPYFAGHLVEILQVWQGGFSGPGAALGGALAALLFARTSGLPLGVLAEALLPLVTSLAVSGWLACWLSGCAYGLPVPWGLAAVDEWGRTAPRLPLQPVGALLALALFWLMEQGLSTPIRRLAPLRRRRTGLGALPERLASWLQCAPPGVLASGMLSLLALEVAGLSCLRGDPAPLIYGLRLDLLAWAVLALLFGLAAWLFSRNARFPAPELPNQAA